MAKIKKANNRKITQDYLDQRYRASAARGFGKAKWILFCETMLQHDLIVTMYEARQTVSKYITVREKLNHRKHFKVRFSNHLPIKHKEISGDCHFFVGVTNLGVTTTGQAIAATLKFFNKEKKNANDINDSRRGTDTNSVCGTGTNIAAKRQGQNSRHEGSETHAVWDGNKYRS